MKGKTQSNHDKDRASTATWKRQNGRDTTTQNLREQEQEKTEAAEMEIEGEDMKGRKTPQPKQGNKRKRGSLS